jgi:hypothetical protein
MRSLSKCCVLLLLSTLAGCSMVGGSDAPAPNEAFDVRLEPRFDSRPRVTNTFEATVSAVRDKDRRTSVTLRDLSRGDTARTLSIPGGVLPAEMLPLVENQRYQLALTFRPYVFGSAPVLKVRDDERLVFFGVTAGKFGATGSERNDLVLPDGWSAQFRDGGFDAHRPGGCGIRTTPKVLEVVHEEQRARLAQGESARLGDYRVRVLVARRVDYNDTSCTDVFEPTVSLVIERVSS